MFRRRTKPDMQIVGNRVVVTPRNVAQDVTIARLTARADLILEELDGVIKQMSAMLKETVK